MHKSQICFYLLISFLSGVFIASVFSISQLFIYTGLIVAIGFIGIFGYNKSFNPAPILSAVGWTKSAFGETKSADRHSERRRDWSGAGGRLLLAGFFGIAFLFGIVRFNSTNFSQDRLDVFTDLKASQKAVEVIVHGYVDDEPTDRGERQEFILRAKELIAGDRVILLDDRILATVNNFPKFYYGDNVSVEGAIQKPQNFGEFDYAAYLKRQNVRATMFYPEILNLGEYDEYYDTPSYHSAGFFEKAKISLYRKIFLLKNNFESAVNKSVAEPNASFINGILLGSRQSMPDNLKEAFNKTGTTHILAISGFNIMIISWVVLTGLVYFFRRRVAFWFSVVVIIIFTVLTGASASVVRAAIMGLLLLFANGYGRLYDPKNSIILAGAAMVWLNPFALVFDIGFQLSFAAVVGLMYLYPKLDAKFKKLPTVGNLKEIILMTISAQAAVAPLLIYYFKNFSLVSLPTNSLILPFIPAAMFAGFISGLVGMVYLPLGQVVGWSAWAITAYQIEVVKLFAKIF